ncbi:amino acid permease C-terminal domain-containing protein, partial [Acinetobacter baumannii]
LFAFAVVSLGVMILRLTDKSRHRSFRTPLLWLVAPLSLIGCVVLFVSLDRASQLVFLAWTGIGLLFYFLYGYHHSNVARGIVEVDGNAD